MNLNDSYPQMSKTRQLLIMALTVPDHLGVHWITSKNVHTPYSLVTLNDFEWLAYFLVHKQVVNGAAYVHKLSALFVKVLQIALQT